MYHVLASSNRLVTLLILVWGLVCLPPAVHAFQLNLAWDRDSDPNISGYKLYYGNSSGTYDRSVNVGNLTNTTVANLQDGLPYYFAVTAYTGNGLESGYSNEVAYNQSSGGNSGGNSGSWGNVTSVPATVGLISPSGTISQSAPTYSWSAVPGADKYYLWVDNASGVKVNVWLRAADLGCPNGTGTCTTTPSTALSQGNYGWNVQASNSAGKGQWSNGLTFNITSSNAGSSYSDASSSNPVNSALISPSGNISQPSPTYTWRAVSGASWYRLWVDDPWGKRVDAWYSANSVGCPSGTGTCSVNPGVALSPGTFGWNVETWNSAGVGSWVPGGSNFTLSY